MAPTWSAGSQLTALETGSACSWRLEAPAFLREPAAA
eukprot:CAMPEP_0177471094 /NCGR_PEP_ID=MMETSP0369-20130122/20572_1 /TAXON_ID=447022 ORGANISM="Scrippsiella hangoei-like, Strain SHHI-4" /NCGR_SAMPLE_ID=MMETSP0369 /ASSEMBLY_ACC=CAM_ASM_000364 /LENGTH=36 /DNA_ID= /DNA_START= /DNA_END= /DNA_ORIENTATION=